MPLAGWNYLFHLNRSCWILHWVTLIEKKNHLKTVIEGAFKWRLLKCSAQLQKLYGIEINILLIKNPQESPSHIIFHSQVNFWPYSKCLWSMNDVTRCSNQIFYDFILLDNFYWFTFLGQYDAVIKKWFLWDKVSLRPHCTQIMHTFQPKLNHF